MEMESTGEVVEPMIGTVYAGDVVDSPAPMLVIPA